MTANEVKLAIPVSLNENQRLILNCVWLFIFYMSLREVLLEELCQYYLFEDSLNSDGVTENLDLNTVEKYA